MLCKTCNIIMRTGISFEQKKGKNLSKYYFECPKCHNKIYTYNANFQDEKKNKELIKKMVNELENGKYLEFYCNDYNKELKKIVNSILFKNFGWISQKDYDDFYSIASVEVWKCEKTYDETKGTFESYLVSCLHRKIKMHISYINAQKRKKRKKDDKGNTIYIHDDSLDRLINESESKTSLLETIDNGFDLDFYIFKEDLSVKLSKYLEKLSKRQKLVLKLLAEFYKPNEIQKILHITQQEYLDALKGIRSYENKSLLF